MKIYTFPRGGINYEDDTVPSKESSTIAFLPALSVIPLIQHSGSKAYPVVSVGDQVTEGMLIGRGSGTGSANVHATVPGKIVRRVSWTMSDGQTNEGMVIYLEGSFDKLGRREEIFPWMGLSAPELRRIISHYGIVEMEGSGRPVVDLIHEMGSRKGSLSLVVRCVFDDPWLAADYILCRERLRAVAEGSAIAARAAGADRIVFAVTHREADLGQQLVEKAETFGIPVSTVAVGSRYPQRNQRELEYALRLYEKKEGVPLGSLLSFSPSTLAAVHDAVILKKPILERYVAVGGSAVKEPKVLKVRLGTRIGEVFAECGGFIEEPRHIAVGSPLLGRPVLDLDEPVTKTSYAIVALLDKQTGKTGLYQCIGCGECRTVCPVGLDPEALYKSAQVLSDPQLGASVIDRARECHGCGCCDVVCPSKIAVSTAIRTMALRRG
ncbi:4Fe-4S dicluster domain-containing protein [Breznakiella homolactica]|uniref:4Fe-4S dicluster domain-containing protein n=1 Tax=Breznakiella homolactica TaxID=2798577 RepID=A0A7T7XK95_9SPIR|nr:4Fe-4S dicluster domain-containing protein [Breznakiella homolactica]QQO07949.1 SLBB domain-containing protein [Breznakiella homolactica]